ncbi:sensor histidine kinase [Microbacterium sp. A84]|uniref:sensor histidine kinase n=1 Tax=Microbacterium sp. A84 TaxID=3450715 RepID=UPI003F435DB3
MDRPRGRLERRTIAVIILAAVMVVLFSIIVPIHTGLYGTYVPLAFLLGAAICAAPLVALTHPRTGIALFCVPTFLLPLFVAADRDPFWPWPWSVPALLAFVVFVAVVTYQHGWRLGLVPLLISLAGSLIAPLQFPQAATANSVTADLIVTASVTGVAYLLAVLLAGRVRLGEELDREREVSAGEQSRRLMVEERTRIARELHDVVAHSMSVIQVQASTARYRMPNLPADAIAEFDDLAATARGSLTEMRRLLGVLRTEDQSAELAPQQGIEDIPALVDSIRRAGVDVGLELVAAHVAAAPAGVQIAAFRIVQESLSNAVRHSPGSSISVRVHMDDVTVRLRVHNTTSTGDAPTQSSGHGLRGMQERVALVNGSLEAGPDADGGWTVNAVLPWAA